MASWWHARTQSAGSLDRDSRLPAPAGHDALAAPAAGGWHESSWDLMRGLSVIEGPLPDDLPLVWLGGFAEGQRAGAV
ncbi:hypothetical protein [Ideonella sp. A 288]|uniref:hypothetical protein n=1 Tax=Ideonella sp. A 288 TaxID=1962181 RepID=UPI000B4BD107|nr:hypothetical protein [Ideonella sp. A 288]